MQIIENLRHTIFCPSVPLQSDPCRTRHAPLIVRSRSLIDVPKDFYSDSDAEDDVFDRADTHDHKDTKERTVRTRARGHAHACPRTRP